MHGYDFCGILKDFTKIMTIGVGILTIRENIVRPEQCFNHIVPNN